ncbi:fibroblast growth factor receptor 2-like [Uloborus diversus]|uniref:fibroblast growth factor receptor 2-like n=1 Tax=Uloborus diversus TaxID=327109 RepID=UPI00240A6DBB|nr:fibroblast growth factor receptor 2-like [Uloborus diversus]
MVTREKSAFCASCFSLNSGNELLQKRPCSYQLYWLPSLGGEFFEQKTVTLPGDNLSAILPGLNFETNYTIKISPYEEREVRKVFPAQGWFITPSCLSITNGNFSLCAPGPPLNVTVFWSPTALEAVLVWLPPLFSSVSNEVSNYYLAVAEISEKFESIMQYRDHILLEKNSSFLTLTDLQPYGLYMFELRAISPGGTGPPAVTELNTKTVKIYTFHFDEIPWHYIIPSGICLLCVLTAAAILQIIQSRRKAKTLIYPNGLADVPDHLLPSLVPSNKIELQDILGHGAFGVVHKGMYAHKKSKKEVAVKTYPAETSTRKRLLDEIDILRLIGRHDHVVSLVGFSLNIDKMYLILELCAMGDLQSYLPRLKKLVQDLKRQQNIGGSISCGRKYALQLCRYIYQVAVGMEHISSLKLIHRDIAARNILMCSEEHVKIADFGLSKDIYETQNYHSITQQRLPIKWMAPEAIEKRRFNVRTDVWSFGVLMWEIFEFGQEPYKGYSNSEILPFLKSGRRLVKPDASNKEWYDLMLECWRADPKRRPSFRELVQKSGDTIAKMSNYTNVVNT